MSQRSFSLPKIKQQREIAKSKDPQDQGEQKYSKKILKQFHRVKWSMAPKCLIEGHEGKDIMYVCIHPTCIQATRLVCETCFFKTHQMHNEQFLAVDEIKLGEIDKLRYWPFEQRFRRMFEFVTKHQSYVTNMIQDVNATFNGMAIRIISSIDKIRLGILKKIDNFYIKESTKKEFCEKVKQQLEKCFELKRIQEVVKQIFSKEVRHDIFLERMNNILNDQQILRNRQILNDYFEKTQKGRDMYFDKMFFLKKENWIIEQIEQQKKTLRETQVIVDQVEIGIEKILPQTIAYLDNCASGFYPLTFEKNVLEDDSEYTGFLSKGIRTIFGMRKYKNGYTYYGEWRINSKNGWGIYENKQAGYKYAGCWREDKRNGYGRQQNLTTVYEGNFVGDKKEGFGILMEEGIRYEITWKNDKKHGSGKKIQKNGMQIEIYYLNGIASSKKSNKVSPAFDLKELTKRFGANSTIQGTKST